MAAIESSGGTDDDDFGDFEDASSSSSFAQQSSEWTAFERTEVVPKQPLASSTSSLSVLPELLLKCKGIFLPEDDNAPVVNARTLDEIVFPDTVAERVHVNNKDATRIVLEYFKPSLSNNSGASSQEPRDGLQDGSVVEVTTSPSNLPPIAPIESAEREEGISLAAEEMREGLLESSEQLPRIDCSNNSNVSESPNGEEESSSSSPLQALDSGDASYEAREEEEGQASNKPEAEEEASPPEEAITAQHEGRNEGSNDDDGLELAQCRLDAPQAAEESEVEAETEAVEPGTPVAPIGTELVL